MKRLIGLMMVAAAITACDEKTVTPIAPSMISNLVATPGTGEPGTPDAKGTITLTWDTPTEGDYRYTQIQWVDPTDNTLKKVNISHFAEPEYTLTGLFKVNGSYTFKAYAVSSTDTFSKDYLEVTSRSQKVPAAVTPNLRKIPLTVDDLASDASDTTEGNLANLVDGDTGTYWHSRWHEPKPPMPQYWTIKLGEEIDRVILRMTSRTHSTNYAIKESKLLATNVADDVDDAAVTWTEIAEFPEGTFRAGSAVRDDTPVAPAGTPTVEPLDYKFRRLKLLVESVMHEYWSYSELEVYAVTYSIFDPDKDMPED